MLAPTEVFGRENNDTETNIYCSATLDTTIIVALNKLFSYNSCKKWWGMHQKMALWFQKQGWTLKHSPDFNPETPVSMTNSVKYSIRVYKVQF